MYAYQNTIDTLKTTLTTALAFVYIIYSNNIGLIILVADINLDG